MKENKTSRNTFYDTMLRACAIHQSVWIASVLVSISANIFDIRIPYGTELMFVNTCVWIFTTWFLARHILRAVIKRLKEKR